MNHVTPQTAQLLKDAGFPQPEPALGQMWGFVRFPEGTARHYKTGIICQYDYQRLVIWCGLGEFEWLKPADQTFHPTATDILKEIGEDYTMVSKPTGFFVIYNAGPYHSYAAKNENPAEAAAKAWLLRNESKNP